MTSAWYDITKTKIGRGSFPSLDGATDLKIIAIKQSGYVFDQTDAFRDAILVGQDVAEEVLADVTFGGTTPLEARLDASDVTFTSPTPGQIVSSFVIYRDTTNPATSELIAFLDNGAGLPITTESGRDLLVTVEAGGLAKL